MRCEPKIIAAILEQPVIEKILTHLGLHACTVSGAGPWPSAASGERMANRYSSAAPVTMAVGVGCVWEFEGPMKRAEYQL